MSGGFWWEIIIEKIFRYDNEKGAKPLEKRGQNEPESESKKALIRSKNSVFQRNNLSKNQLLRRS